MFKIDKKELKDLFKKAYNELDIKIHNLTVKQYKKYDLFEVYVLVGKYLINSCKYTLSFDTVKQRYQIMSIEGITSLYDINYINEVLNNE